MISFKKLLGKDEKFYDLLEASAEEAKMSAELLAKILKDENSGASNIQALSLALYKIPKTVEKLVERLTICPARVPRESMQRQIVLLVEAVDAVDFMVKQLRKGSQVDRIQDAQTRLQFAEGEADKVMLALVKDLYNGPYDAKEVVILMELYDLVESAVDRARDAGQVVFQIMLKYA